MIGDTVGLLCTAKGEPPITYSWEKDNRKIQNHIETGKPHQSSILSVKLINDTSYGQYICHIQDRFSNMTHTITIQDIPGETLNIIYWFIATMTNDAEFTMSSNDHDIR
jgi:hypothetical protein